MNHKAPIYLFLLLIVISPMGIDIYLPALPQMADNLQTPMANIQTTITLFLAALGLGQLLAGPLADRYGRRPLILSGLLLYIFGSAVAALAMQIEVLWLARILQGLGTCAVSVGVMSGVRDSYSTERTASIYSYINGVICVIPALAPMLGGWLSETWDWRATFYFMAGYALSVTLFALLRLPETRPSNTISSPKLINWKQYQPILQSHTFRFNAGLVMLAMAIIIAFVSVAPVRLMVELDLDPTTFSLWFGSNALINILGSFTAPIIIRRLGQSRALKLAIAMCTLAAASILLLQGVDSPIAFMGPVFIASTGFCLTLAICCSAALAPFSERAGTAASLLGFFQMAGASTLIGIVNFLPLGSLQMMALFMSLPLIWYVVCRRKSNYEVCES
ncbi:multidrug effflux MFS transporter [Vibrio breoganii]|uniref:Bcr/CflA family efflux transporter n=1 Tax=Vibrio breoganii TaxID=553239 RepID=A0ABX1U6P0_9VIBR|nr:multidrug effflux MFS transporter [Vibrio breoganii]NMO73499.1 multidrug effflux MFS transporter [Vibrio breoganii]NMR70122.1 multidrug effflux MFS transporter [Vibrio breoganii]PML89194.1 Bcr/CflA family drug resistance efflux transporter [Vibrio breoganii]